MKADLFVKAAGLVLALGVAACGQNNTASVAAKMATAGHNGVQNSSLSSGTEIIGGTNVSDSDPIAAMTAMLYDVKAGALCTASVLSDEWLITAGHCVEGSAPTDLRVIFTTDIAILKSASLTPAQKLSVMKDKVRAVADFHQHPGYAATMAKLDQMQTQAKAKGGDLSSADIDNVKDWGDLTLIHISGKIPTTYRAADILPPTGQLAKSQQIVLAGYGNTSGGDNGTGAGVLRQTVVSIAEPVWGTSEVLFNQTNGHGGCHGDSGGPAYVSANGKLYLFGVTSRGVRDENNTCGQYAAYTNMQAYRTWIKQVAGL
jgi:hypothetical protein